MRFLKWLLGLFQPAPTPQPQPEPEPDPVLPAKALTLQWGKDPQQTVTLYMPARRAAGVGIAGSGEREAEGQGEKGGVGLHGGLHKMRGAVLKECVFHGLLSIILSGPSA